MSRSWLHRDTNSPVEREALALARVKLSAVKQVRQCCKYVLLHFRKQTCKCSIRSPCATPSNGDQPVPKTLRFGSRSLEAAPTRCTLKVKIPRLPATKKRTLDSKRNATCSGGVILLLAASASPHQPTPPHYTGFYSCLTQVGV